jgi:uncharacterized membrane protein YfcA
MTWQLVLAGLLIGTLVGLTGMGGGSLMTPILVIVFGFKPTVAIGTDIVHGALFKTVGAIRHRQLGNVQARLSGWMFLGSAPTSLLGVALATWLTHRYGDSVDAITGRVLGAALVFGALGLFAKSLLRPKAIASGAVPMTNRNRIAAVLIGLFGGFVLWFLAVITFATTSTGDNGALLFAAIAPLVVPAPLLIWKATRPWAVGLLTGTAISTIGLSSLCSAMVSNV